MLSINPFFQIQSHAITHQQTVCEHPICFVVEKQGHWIGNQLRKLVSHADRAEVLVNAQELSEGLCYSEHRKLHMGQRLPY